MYQASFSKTKITFPYLNIGLMGYGMWKNRAKSYATNLYVRTFALQQKDSKSVFFFVNVEMAFITPSIRREVIAELNKINFTINEQALMLTAQHTHSAPSGFSEYAYYSFTTPRFRPAIQKAYVDAIVQSILMSFKKLEPVDLYYKMATFQKDIPVAWNRSVEAYINNPEVANKQVQSNEAIDRRMQLLQVINKKGKLLGSINWFGVHATCIGNKNTKISSDNKGYASYFLEQEFKDTIHLFAQSKAGDVSPHFHGKNQEKIRAKISKKGEHIYAKQNGLLQYQKAKEIIEQEKGIKLKGEIKAGLFFSDYTNIQVDSKYTFNRANQQTSEACFGLPFYIGTPIDGKGIPLFFGSVLRMINNKINKSYTHLKSSQGNKEIILNACTKDMLGTGRMDVFPSFVDLAVAEMNTQYRAGALKENTLTPIILPIQIITIGQLAIVGIPGEITTIAGKRIEKQVLNHLQKTGIEQVVLSSYANSYMGYITTPEEYTAQLYEAGHALFGQWTLGAFQTEIDKLCRCITESEQCSTAIDFNLRPPLFSDKELKLRSK